MPAPGTVTRQRYKVVVLGAPSAGKTALVRRLADGSFVEGACQRGLDFYTCQVPLRDDVTVALQLWDLSDCPCRPEDDHSPLAAYVFNSQAILFVYDVSCPSSLEVLRYALRAVEAAAAAATGGARPYLALVANKCDLQGTASEALARELAARHCCVRFTLSARSGQGVSRTAVQLACDLAGVPLAAATEYSARELEPSGAPLAPPRDFASSPSTGKRVGPEQGFGPAQQTAAELDADADTCAGRLPSGSSTAGIAAAAVAALQQWQATVGKFYARAPAYQASAQTRPQESGPGSLDEFGMYGLAGGGGRGEQAWRPISRSVTPSRAATLISKTGPLGQRVSSASQQQLPPPSLAVSGWSEPAAKGGAAAVASPARPACGAGAVLERSGGPLSSSGSLSRRQSKGWRGLLCCLPARRHR